METKIIDGKEYTKIGIKEFSINGEKNDNSFSVNNLNSQNEISFDIKVDYKVDTNPTTFTIDSSDNKNIDTSNIKINSEISSNNQSPMSPTTETSKKDLKINYWFYVILGMGLLGIFYFLFIK